MFISLQFTFCISQSQYELEDVHVVLLEWVLGLLVFSGWEHLDTLEFSWVKTHIILFSTGKSR